MQYLGYTYTKKLFVVYPTFRVSGHPACYLATLLTRLSMGRHLSMFTIHLTFLFFLLAPATLASRISSLSSFWAFVLMSPSAWTVLPSALCAAFSFSLFRSQLKCPSLENSFFISKEDPSPYSPRALYRIILFLFIHKVSLYLSFFCLLAFSSSREREAGFVSFVPGPGVGLMHGRSSGNNLWLGTWT